MRFAEIRSTLTPLAGAGEGVKVEDCVAVAVSVGMGVRVEVRGRVAVSVGTADSVETGVSVVRGGGGAVAESLWARKTVVWAESLHPPVLSCARTSRIFFPGARVGQAMLSVASVALESAGDSLEASAPLMEISNATMPLGAAPCAMSLHGLGG